jgi:ferredoxin
MKAHHLTGITGAVKNLFGCIYGLNKITYHTRLSDPVEFSRMLVDLAKLVKPRLNIMDGIIAMEGNGPSSGDPVEMKVLLISDDPIAVDSVFCRLIGLPPDYIATNTFGKEAGLGSYEDDEIELVGDDIKPLINKKFVVDRKPIVNEKFPDSLKSLKNLIVSKPYIIKNKCLRCGICVESCPVKPVKALDFRNMEKDEPPVYDYDKCIRCFCCQEMCPHRAINVKSPLLGKLFIRRRSHSK